MTVVFSNISALRAKRQVDKTSNDLAGVFERLGSGMRINRASDDPAGLALADRLKLDARLATVAIRNANDAISLVSAADGALGEISNILRRMAELAEQATNGAINNVQRKGCCTFLLYQLHPQPLASGGIRLC